MPRPSWVFASKAIKEGTLTVLQMDAFQALSRLYEVAVELQSTGDVDLVDANLDALMLHPAHVGNTPAGGEKIWGVLRSIELLTSVGTAMPVYRAVLVPRLWSATLVHRSRVFQDTTVPMIVRIVLRGLGFHEDTDFRVEVGDYRRREYTVQYEESDYAFMGRLLEDEGIAFRFEHGRDHETVVFTDSNLGMRMPPSCKHVVYRDGSSVEEGVVTALTRKRTIVPLSVQLVDYDWRKPDVGLVATFPVHERSRPAISTTADHYLDSNFGSRLARIRAEERLVERDVWRLQSTVPELCAGDIFGLDMPVRRAAATDLHHDHPAIHGEYLVVELRKRVDQRSQQESTAERREERDDVVAIRADVTYRPPRTTPKPRIDGLLYAWIDGVELGTPAPIDPHGCYKVVLPFDPVPKDAGRASRWIRMAQPLAGPGVGMHFPLHEGTEVVLAHVQGDPDRPLIVGAVSNARTPSTVTSANPTQSVIRTYTGITMEFEDDA